MPPECSSKMRMNSSPMALRLSSGSVIAREPLEEAVAGVDVDELDALVAAERLDDLLALALAHQPGVDEHAGELGADGPVDQRGGHRGVDPAGQAADGPAVADLGPDGVDLRSSMIDAMVHVGGQPHTSNRKRSSSSWPRGRVDHLGVELDAVDPPAGVLQAATARPACGR